MSTIAKPSAGIEKAGQAETMTALIIDGKAIAESMAVELAEKVKNLPYQPGLAVVVVGDDDASHRYVRSKVKKSENLGIHSVQHALSTETTQQELLGLIDQLNSDEAVDGILVQLPLPKHIEEHAVIEAIDPDKDVDGFHHINIGKLTAGQPGLVPCTPKGCLILIQNALGQDLSGKKAVVMGRSNIVGKPMARLLEQQHCTVTTVHSRTQDPQKLTRAADILVVAVGQPNLITKDWVKPGATVIDVGINRDTKGELCGDVDFESVKEVAAHLTPVPGGVGPMTISCLMDNTVQAARMRRER